MSVLERIESGTFAVCKYHEWDSGDYYTKEPEATGELLRLARLGAEAEKAIKRCCLYTEDCRIVKDKCFLQEVCKMVREGSTLSESEMVVSKTERATMTAEQAINLLKTEKYTLWLSDRIEIAALIERLQSCQSCEKLSNQFFDKCEGCEVMQNEP